VTSVPARAGRDERSLCGAAKRQGTGTCTQPAGWGTDHLGFGRCKLHGGRTSSHTKSAARLVLADTVANLAEDLRPAVEGVHPLDVQLGAVEGAHLMRLVYERLVHQLAPQPDADNADGQHGDAQELREALYGRDHLGDLRTHPLVEGLERWTRTAGDLSSKALAAGVDERRVRLAESHGRLVADVVVGVVGDIETAARELVAEGALRPEGYRRLVEETIRTSVERHLKAASVVVRGAIGTTEAAPS
jgi:hypothetical protein